MATKIDTTDTAQLEAGRALVVQYLNEAHATESALVTTLQAHITMTPQGEYRQVLERHLAETRTQARAIERRLGELGQGSGLFSSTVGLVQSVVGQVLSLSKGPVDMLRGHGGEEKLVKNAKDECATEALEIATYDSLEALAKAVGDAQTERLAVTHRKQEERMLADLRRLIPSLTDAAVAARAGGTPSYDVSETGAADNVRALRDKAQKTSRAAASRASSTAKGTARKARKVPGEEAVEGEVRGAVVDAADLPIEGYDELTAGEVVTRLTDLTQVQLRTVAGYERRNRKRRSVLERIEALEGEEPWAGFDDADEATVVARLEDGDETLADAVREYESRHRRRVAVLEAAQRQRTRS